MGGYHSFTIYILFLIFSLTHFTFTANCRFLKTQTSFLPSMASAKIVSEEKTSMLRAIIGSRPPRCERRCISCVHCEAIQVPANPQEKPKNSSSNSTSIATKLYKLAYSRGDYSSNYKPMSWKCKCGNFIFNP